ncbi:hypothetical protein T484DRAFT_1662104, partial [Baffinella frigidus]
PARLTVLLSPLPPPIRETLRPILDPPLLPLLRHRLLRLLVNHVPHAPPLNLFPPFPTAIIQQPPRPLPQAPIVPQNTAPHPPSTASIVVPIDLPLPIPTTDLEFYLP